MAGSVAMNLDFLTKGEMGMAEIRDVIELVSVGVEILAVTEKERTYLRKRFRRGTGTYK